MNYSRVQSRYSRLPTEGRESVTEYKVSLIFIVLRIREVSNNISQE